MIRIFTGMLIVVFSCGSCATIIHGYQKEVEIVNAPKDLSVETYEGVAIPVQRESLSFKEPYTGKEKATVTAKINLRAKENHILVLKYGGKKEIFELHGKIEPFMLVLDTVFGLYPAFVDAYTGNWYRYDDIVIPAEQQN